VKNDIVLVPDYPANLARSLINGDIDMGLVPVAVIPQLEKWWLVGDYCIGAEGAVASVCIFSEVPIDKVTRVYLDYQSRTSVELAKILLKEYWQVSPELVHASAGFEDNIRGTEAALVIGDRSLQQRKISTCIYDLAEAWKNHTGLPFVFAAWVSNTPLDESFVNSFNAANEYGVQHISEVIAGLDNQLFDLEEYYRKYISYRLDMQKRKALDLFLQYLRS